MRAKADLNAGKAGSHQAQNKRVRYALSCLAKAGLLQQPIKSSPATRLGAKAPDMPISAKTSAIITEHKAEQIRRRKKADHFKRCIDKNWQMDAFRIVGGLPPRSTEINAMSYEAAVRRIDSINLSLIHI